MEKSRFDIISNLFKLSNVISESLKLAEPLYDKSSGSGENDCKDICRNIRYSLKPLPFLLAGIREYVTEHEDKDLARKFVELHDDTKRLHGICSKYADWNKAAFRTGVAYLSMEVIGQYFFPQSAGIKMFHIAMTMGYVKRNVLHENEPKSATSQTIPSCMEEAFSGFIATDTMQGGAFSTTAQVPVLRLYRFLFNEHNITCKRELPMCHFLILFF